MRVEYFLTKYNAIVALSKRTFFTSDYPGGRYQKKKIKSIITHETKIFKLENDNLIRYLFANIYFLLVILTLMP